ncbi:hypothetical protein [Ursidibacter sp. B-7004-1]
MLLNLENSMCLVFNLKEKNDSDIEHVKAVQELTLNKSKPNIGLKGRYGLYNSSEWWCNIENNIIPHKILSGTITRLYSAGQDNYTVNSFEFIGDNGDEYSSGIYLNKTEDIKKFSIGKKIYIYYIIEELKVGETVDLVIEMAISI